MADGVNDRDQVRREHAEWSQTTFGNVGPIGPLKHLSKEALEAAAEPGDLSEWADMQFLLWDAQRRAGITDEQITQAMIEKLAVNKLREWPEPKDGEPRLHIKEQPAPAVPYVLERLRSIVSDPRALPRRKEWISGQQYSYVLLDNVEAMVDEACRAATLQAGNSPVIPDGSVSMLRRWLAFGRGMQNAGSQLPHNLIAETENMLAAAPQPQNAPQNIPEIIPGWIPVSERLPEKNQSVLISVNFDSSLVDPLICTARYTGSTFRRGEATVKPGSGIEEVTHWMPLPAAPQEVNHG
ncbi:TPA: dATP/dGTP pyrophosphohydrolase domain-containing protein [Raoultella ornithinolytica]